eukprot:12920807-Prorocentrum_lima.AAC.1
MTSLIAQPKKALRRVDRQRSGRTPEHPAALAIGVMRPHDHNLTTSGGRLPFQTAAKSASSKLGNSPTTTRDCRS